jgi:integrase
MYDLGHGGTSSSHDEKVTNMAKKDDFDITTTAGRKRLAIRRDPYFRRENGGHLGFRCTGENGEGTWIGRAKGSDGYEYNPLGRFSDYRDALGEFEKWIEHLGMEKQGSLSKDSRTATVADAARHYLAWIDETRESESARNDIRSRIEGLILGREKKPRGRACPPHPIAKVRLADLNRKMLEDFHKGLLNGKTEATADRKTKNTANRNWTPIVAMLNKAIQFGLIGSDIAWNGIEPFGGAAAGHKDSFRYLTKEERGAILKEIPAGESRDFATLLCLIGARPVELERLTAGDYDRRTQMLNLWSYKGSKGKKTDRFVPVGVMGDAAKIIERNIKDKLPSAPIFPMNKTQRQDALRDAVKAAKIRGATAYCFRHSFITDCIVGGVNVLEVARICGTSMQMIQKTYGKLLTDSVAKAFKGIKLVA